MRLNLKKPWLLVGGVVAVIIIVVAVVALLVSHNDTVSRQQAQTAAAAYTKAAHNYLTALNKQMTVAGSAKDDKKIYAALDSIKKQQASRPNLQTVKGPGAQLPVYTTAAVYQQKVDKLDASISAYIKAANDFRAIDYAYISLNGVQQDLDDGKLGSSDPVTSLQNIIVNPLTAAQADFQKAAVPAQYNKIASDITAAFKDYIDAGNTLITMYQTGNMHSVNFNFVPQLDVIYDETKPVYNQLNNTQSTLSSQLGALLKQQ